MQDARRLNGRLFYWAMIFAASFVAQVVAQSGPALTTIQEVRWSDEGWGVGNSRNLLGRFTTQTFALPRLARTVSFFVQQYDASSPPRYSRFSAALHLDYPLTATM
jgi:hypothetical protein